MCIRDRGEWMKVLSDLNVCSQKGLVEMFDGSIGAGSVFMPVSYTHLDVYKRQERHRASL